MHSQHILYTGGTGAFGAQLARRLVGIGFPITFIVRGDDYDLAYARLQAALGEKLESHHHILLGDTSRAKLGLSDASHTELKKNITSIIHAAASTRFDLTASEARLQNVVALENILSLASGAPNLQKIGYLGTAFAAGKQTGLIANDEIKPYAGQVNHYDGSKYLSECILREAMRELPITIYRPSLIIGESSKPNHAAVALLNLLRRGLLPVVPGKPRDQLDLISDKDASSAIVDLFTDHFAPGEIYNITSGQHAPTLERFQKNLAPSQNVIYTGHNETAYEQGISRVVAQAQALHTVYQKADPFIKYLLYPKVFDNSATEAKLGRPISTIDTVKILSRLLKHG